MVLPILTNLYLENFKNMLTVVSHHSFNIFPSYYVYKKMRIRRINCFFTLRSERPKKFNSFCVAMVSRCWSQLQALSVGGQHVKPEALALVGRYPCRLSLATMFLLQSANSFCQYMLHLLFIVCLSMSNVVRNHVCKVNFIYYISLLRHSALNCSV